MFRLRPRASSLIAPIIAATPSLHSLLLRPHHMAVLAQTTKVLRHVRTVREDVVYLIRLRTTENATTPITNKNTLTNLPPILG